MPKKLICMCTIMNMKDDSIYKILVVFIQRAMQFNTNIRNSAENGYDSPVYEIIRTAVLFCIYIMSMVTKNHVYIKMQWKRIVLTRAWEMEDED